MARFLKPKMIRKIQSLNIVNWDEYTSQVIYPQTVLVFLVKSLSLFLYLSVQTENYSLRISRRSS